MSLSQIAKTINASPTLALNERAAILKEKGDPVIHLGGGEPKSKAPMDAIVSAASLLNSAEVRYAPADGIPALKKAIIRYTEEFYHRLGFPIKCNGIRGSQASNNGCVTGNSESSGRSFISFTLLGKLS